MFYLEIIIIAVIAYLFGSISSAIIVCKLWGLPDPRTQGSKNPGATNVLRLGGKIPATLTLMGDVLKGFIPVFIVKLLSFSPVFIAVALFFAFIGHLYPLFFRFVGGKGVATLLGGLLALSWPIGLSWLLAWLLIVLICRYVSVASMVASLFAVLDTWIITQNTWYTVTVGLMAVIVIYRHQSNIQNLFSGKEHQFGTRKKST